LVSNHSSALPAASTRQIMPPGEVAAYTAPPGAGASAKISGCCAVQTCWAFPAAFSALAAMRNRRPRWPVENHKAPSEALTTDQTAASPVAASRSGRGASASRPSRVSAIPLNRPFKKSAQELLSHAAGPLALARQDAAHSKAAVRSVHAVREPHR
jgi:hypothetical protein